MSQFLQIFIWIPLISFLGSLVIPRKKENMISGFVISLAGAHLVTMAIFQIIWMFDGFPTLDVKHLVLFNSGNIEIFISFYFDRVTSSFALVGSLLTLLVCIFSKFYMHREEGFKRYFVTLTLFFSSYNIIVFSGNFETLFVGWEVIGICSFLLIAFYRDRYLPVKNGLKVISFFRLADVCLVLAMWMSHHLWHENITFAKLNDPELVGNVLPGNVSIAAFIAVMMLLAAIVKSAQFPFTSWLPRAMEGPTTSSAVFYGSLSVHLGIFLLLRTYPFWEQFPLARIIIGVVGVVTALVSAGIARVQSTVKTQIAYASATQIGIMFVEVAMGFHVLAMIHFAGNAFLRTYQLLVSPSVMSYLVHHQFYHFKPSKRDVQPSAFERFSNTLYVLCLREWDLDHYLYRYLWMPFKWLGKKLTIPGRLSLPVVFGVLYMPGLYSFFANERLVFHEVLPYLYSLMALMLILKSFSHRGDPVRAWLFIFFSQFFIALSILLNKQFDFSQVLMYLSGGVLSGVVGYICLTRVGETVTGVDMNRHHGLSYERPALSLVFLLSCLGMVAFPISPAFIGFDVLLTHVEPDQVVLIMFIAMCFIFLELSVLRIYSRVFLGQHRKTDHAMAFRSS